MLSLDLAPASAINRWSIELDDLRRVFRRVPVEIVYRRKSIILEGIIQPFGLAQSCVISYEFEILRCEAGWGRGAFDKAKTAACHLYADSSHVVRWQKGASGSTIFLASAKGCNLLFSHRRLSAVV